MLPSHIKYYQKNKSNEGLQNDGADIDFQTVSDLVLNINRKLWRLDNDHGPPPDFYDDFFIGPRMYWKKTGNNYEPILIESQFSYTVNCHGDYVNRNPIPRKFIDWLDWI